MNDVLPKPFTKEGLLQMLEKHLGHLKKTPNALDHMGAPPPPTLAQMAAKNSLKSEDSPATSPATVSNWNSPGANLGVSPAASNVTADDYIAMSGQAGHGAVPAPYQLQPGMPPPIAYGRPTPAASQPPGPPQHRRQISEISGGPGDMGGDAKRQQIFQQGPPPVALPAHLTAPHAMHQQPMRQPLQNAMNPMQGRPG